MQFPTRIVLGALILGAVGVSFYRHGLPVRPVVVADFNNNGTQDLLYRTGAGEMPMLDFIDGRLARKSSDGYYDVPLLRGKESGVYLIRNYYTARAEDKNHDGKLDVVLEADPTIDPDIYEKLGKLKIVFVGNGWGDFFRSEELSY